MKIEFINSKKIKFKDGPEYKFLDSNPPPSSWTTDHDYDVIDKGDGKGIKTTKVINKSLKDQERVVTGDDSIHKGYKIEKQEVPPEEVFGRNLRIEAFLGDRCIVVEKVEPLDETVWQLDDVDGCERDHTVQISKGIGRFKTRVNVKNLDLHKDFIASFIGYVKYEW